MIYSIILSKELIRKISFIIVHIEYYIHNMYNNMYNNKNI